ncbi:unnamed protein product, partial [Rhizoctonia solani]
FLNCSDKSIGLYLRTNGIIAWFSFLAWRTWNFARRVRSGQISRHAIQALGAMAGALSLAQLTFGLVATAFSWKVRYFVKAAQYQWIATSWLGSAAVCDVLIVCSLSTILIMHRTGFKRTDMIINRILIFTINTGLLTSVVATIDLVLFCSMPTNFSHLVPNFQLGTRRSSSSSFSDSAQSATALRSNRKWNVPADIPLARRTSGSTQNPTIFGPQLPQMVRVQVKKETCIEELRKHGSTSQLSGDQYEIRCYDANKNATLV